MVIHKNYIRNRVIITVIITTITALVIGLITKISVHNLLIAFLLAVVTSFVVSYGLLLLIVKFIFPQLKTIGGKSSQKSPLNQNININIHYIINIEDIYLYYINHDKYYLHITHTWDITRKLIFIGLIVDIFCALIIYIILGQQGLLFSILIGIFAIIILIYFLYSPKLRLRLLKKRIESKYAQTFKLLVGTHDLSIDSEKIEDVSGNGNNLNHWEAVTNIATIGEYSFITFKDSAPLIIPKTAFVNETEFRHFNYMINEYYKAKITK